MVLEYCLMRDTVYSLLDNIWLNFLLSIYIAFYYIHKYVCMHLIEVLIRFNKLSGVIQTNIIFLMLHSILKYIAQASGIRITI